MLPAFALVGPALLAGAPALANGQSTHVWISLHALEHLPEGELRELLLDPELQAVMVNGTMFPDGGYPLGDDYAEIAHWEPFQNRYRAWIASACAPPYTDDCAEHIAFLLGMASHGMADQVFDALYYERGLQHDAESDFSAHSFDQSTDVVFMSIVGRVDYPEDHVPYDTLVALYAEVGHTVDADTLATGQALLRIAIHWVGNASEDPELTAQEAAWFPWLTSHLDDPEVPGTPPCEGEVVAAYWQSVYRRLQGDLSFEPELLATFPEGGFGLETDAALVESRISAVFSQAIDADSLDDDKVVVTDPDGRVLPTTAWLYYRDGSHVLHIAPAEDWAEDTAYTVTLGAGIETLDGQRTTGDTRFTVSTAAPPPPEDSGDSEAGQDGAAGGCGCTGAGAGGSLAGLLVGLAVAGRRRLSPAPRPSPRSSTGAARA